MVQTSSLDVLFFSVQTTYILDRSADVPRKLDQRGCPFSDAKEDGNATRTAIPT
jgi:hypothetical protein